MMENKKYKGIKQVMEDFQVTNVKLRKQELGLSFSSLLVTYTEIENFMYNSKWNLSWKILFLKMKSFHKNGEKRERNL